MHQPHKPLTDDPLFREIVAAAVDEECADLAPDARHACIVNVSQRLDAEFWELLHAGTLTPEGVTAHLRNEVRKAIEPPSLTVKTDERGIPAADQGSIAA